MGPEGRERVVEEAREWGGRSASPDPWWVRPSRPFKRLMKRAGAVLAQSAELIHSYSEPGCVWNSGK